MPTSERTRGFNIALLIVLHLLIVVPLAWSLNIWADEASTLYSTQHGLIEAFQNAATNEKQAPLYFWTMALWRDLNGSIFFARLFSVICGVASIKLVSDLARRLFDARATLLITGFFALHPFVVWASLEIRVYALVILLTTALLGLFFSTFVEEGAGRLRYLAFAGLATGALYTNYYLAFPLAGMFLALLATKRWKQAGTFLAVSAVVGAAFLPMLIAARSQLAVNTGGYQEPRMLIEGIRTLWHHFLTFILPAGIFVEGDEGLAIVIRVWLVRIALGIGLILAIKNRGQLTRRTAILSIVTAACFLCLLAGYFVLGPRYLEVRHATVLFVPLVLTTASFIWDLFEKASDRTCRFVSLAVGLIVLLSFAYSLTVLYPHTTKRGDWARIGEFIEDREKPGQPIVVFTVFDAMALPNHYHGANHILPNRGYFDYDLEAEFGTSGSLSKETDFVISQIPPDADQIWLAVNEKCTSTSACEPLQNYIRAHYTIELEQQFYLEKLYLLRKNAQ